MPTWERWIADQEADQLGKWAAEVERRLLDTLTRQARARGGRGDCFPVMVSTGKDADLEAEGCTGVARLVVAEDEVRVTFGRHWSQDWCETCDEPHRICDFFDGCEAADADVDAAAEETVQAFALPEAVQALEHSDQAFDTLAGAILQALEKWAER